LNIQPGAAILEGVIQDICEYHSMKALSDFWLLCAEIEIPDCLEARRLAHPLDASSRMDSMAKCY
jgi:hypothetical protein